MARTRDESRSKIMASIRRRDTKPEVVVRKELWRRGIRGYRVDVALPGRPDLYFPKMKVCVFVDGCFWHGCPIHFKGVSTNKAYWDPKIARNMGRDSATSDLLQQRGLSVRRFWEHEVTADNGSTVATIIEELIRSLQKAGHK